MCRNAFDCKGFTYVTQIRVYTSFRFSLCSGFGWDSDGDLLGIICQSSQLVLWDANTNKKHSVDVGLRDIMTCLVWAKNSPTLAIGTAKGNMSIYNHNTSK